MEGRKGRLFVCIVDAGGIRRLGNKRIERESNLLVRVRDFGRIRGVRNKEKKKSFYTYYVEL